MTGYRMAEQHGPNPNKRHRRDEIRNGGPAKNGHVNPDDGRPTGSEKSLRSNRCEIGGNLSLLEQLEAARAERDANYNLYLRSQAELQNYRKRVQKEADEMRLVSVAAAWRATLLPALDNLHRALAARRDFQKHRQARSREFAWWPSRLRRPSAAIKSCRSKRPENPLTRTCTRPCSKCRLPNIHR